MKINQVSANAPTFKAQLVKPGIFSSNRALHNRILDEILENGDGDEFIAKCEELKQKPHKGKFEFKANIFDSELIGICEKSTGNRYTFTELHEHDGNYGKAGMKLIDDLLENMFINISNDSEPTRNLNKEMKKVFKG